MKVSLFALALAAVAGFSSADKASFFYNAKDCSGTPDEVITMPGCNIAPDGAPYGSASFYRSPTFPDNYVEIAPYASR
jgi:hypothetical protein